MPDTPEFSTQDIAPEPKPKKRAPRKPAVKKTSNAPEINRAINAIYQDDAGRLPNMKKIDKQQNHPVVRFFASLLILSGVLAAAAWVGFFILPTSNKFSDSQVMLTVDGPVNATMGATTTYKIDYRNNQNINLKNASLSIRYPDGFVFIDSSIPAKNGGHTEWDLGTLVPYKKNSITITGKMYGASEQASSWRVFLNYQPENFNSELQKTAILNLQMDKSPLAVKITGPDKATVGSEVEYTFALENSGNWIPENLYLDPVLPTNFHLVTSSPKLEKNRWTVILNPNSTSTPPLSGYKFTLRGTYSDSSTSSTEPMRAALSLPIKLLDQEFKIAENNLPIALVNNVTNFSVAINGNLKDFSTQPGDTLNFTLNIKNTGETDMKKAQVKINIDAPSLKNQSLLNWKAINDKYDADIIGQQLSDTVRRGQIIWNTSKVPELAKIIPGNEINIDFSLPIKDADTATLSDFVESKVVIGAKINYTDGTGANQTINAAPITVTLNSDLKFENRHSVNSADGKDAYDIKWIITNNFHALKNIKLSANIYGDTTFTTPQNVPAGEVKFDDAEKKITWTVPEMPEGVDVLALPLNVVLNKKNPTQNMVVGKVHVTADDTVTGQSIDFMGDEIAL